MNAMDAFENLELLLKTYWLVAIPTSLFFIFQTLMIFIGGGHTDGTDADFDTDGSHFDGTDTPLQLLSLRNFINFLLGFSWTGISFYTTITNKVGLFALSLGVGFLFLYFFFMILKKVQQLSEDNSFNIENTLFKTAEVYLPIPEKKSGKGKIMISVKGAFHELDAMTENESIPSNTIVKVVKIEANNLLIVEPI